MNTWGTQRVPAIKISFLYTHLLQNVIQENIKIIYFDQCMIMITKIYIKGNDNKDLYKGYIFLSCKQGCVSFWGLFWKIMVASKIIQKGHFLNNKKKGTKNFTSPYLIKMNVA